MANILGPVIGAAIDRRDGDSGIKGALLGSLIQSGARAATTLGVVIAVGWVIKKVITSPTKSSDADVTIQEAVPAS